MAAVLKLAIDASNLLVENAPPLKNADQSPPLVTQGSRANPPRRSGMVDEVLAESEHQLMEETLSEGTSSNKGRVEIAVGEAASHLS